MIAKVNAERLGSALWAGEIHLLTVVVGDVELLLRDIRKVLKKTPLAGGHLTQASILETRSLFAFWANHVLWQAGQVAKSRGALVELLSLAASIEYFGRSPSRNELESIGDIVEYRALEYRKCTQATEFTALLHAYLRNLEESTSGVLPDPSVPFADRPIRLFDPLVGMELGFFITTDMKYLQGVLLRLVEGVTDFNSLSPVELDSRTKSACRPPT